MSFDLVSWLRHSALPLWGELGIDRESGMFVERLDLDGRPLPAVPRRLMVQARQIFVFTEAEAQGWYAGAELAERAAEAMVRTFHCEDGGWIFSVAPDGRPIEETRDLYAHAFVLFALASMRRLTGSARWLNLAEETLDFLDEHLATPATGGYADSSHPEPGLRRQNPHMHILEALLCLDELVPGGPYRRRAETIIQLFKARFLHGPRPVLVELYDDDLRPASGPPFSFEPGHHFEWAWLLARDAALAGRSGLPALAVDLCRTAHRFGMTKAGTFLDEVDGDGNAIKTSTRLWPCTEALRATAAGLLGPAAATDVLADAIHRSFLSPAEEGCWIDHLAADGQPLCDYVPASSLYHIMGAASALADVDKVRPKCANAR